MYYRNGEIAIVRQVLGEIPRKELAQHFFALGKAGKLWMDDSQVKDAPVLINDSLYNKVLHIFKPMVEEIFDREMFPTYSCARLYREGDKLGIHKDREACEYSLSVNLSRAWTHDDPQWSLYIKSLKGEEEQGCHTYEGEAVFYKGFERAHFRNACPYQWSLQGFWHYIERGGEIYESFRNQHPDIDSYSHYDLKHNDLSDDLLNHAWRP